VRFLDEARARQAKREDVDAYHRARRLDEVVNCISAVSWNRAIAALDRPYRRAVEAGPTISIAYRASYTSSSPGIPASFSDKVRRDTNGSSPAVGANSHRHAEPSARLSRANEYVSRCDL
jgi:hypothetical protein